MADVRRMKYVRTHTHTHTWNQYYDDDIYHNVYFIISSLSTQKGNTALFYAGWKGHSEIVKLLLQAGARDITNKACTAITSPSTQGLYHPMGPRMHVLYTRRGSGHKYIQSRNYCHGCIQRLQVCVHGASI